MLWASSGKWTAAICAGATVLCASSLTSVQQQLFDGTWFDTFVDYTAPRGNSTTVAPLLQSGDSPFQSGTLMMAGSHLTPIAENLQSGTLLTAATPLLSDLVDVPGMQA